MIRTYLGNRLIDEATFSGPNYAATVNAHMAVVAAELSTYSPQTGDTLKTEWNSPGCFPHDQKEITAWVSPETRDAWIDRHFDAVLAAMALCPPG